MAAPTLEPSSTPPVPADLPAPILHHLSSSQSMRVLWALEELALAHGVQYSVKYYTRQQGRAPAEMRDIFPLGKAPILEIPGVELFRPQNMASSGKKTVITESRLILQLLSDTYSKGEWVPAPEDKDRDTWFQEFSNTTFLPICDRILTFEAISSFSPWIVRPLLSAIFSPIIKMFRKDVAAPMDLMEGALSDSKPWLAGAKIGLADLNMIFPMDVAAQRKYFDTKKYPKLTQWLKRIHEREAYKNAIQKGGSYDLVTFDM